MTLDKTMSPLLSISALVAVCLVMGGCTRTHPAEKLAIAKVMESFSDAEVKTIRVAPVTAGVVEIEVDFWHTPLVAFPQKKSLWTNKMKFREKGNEWMLIEVRGITERK